MRKLVLLFLIFSASLQAQKYAIVDTDYVLSKLADYKEAESKITELAKRFEEKITEEYEKVKQLEFQFQKDEFLYSAELKDLKLTEIKQQRKKAKDTETRYFGTQGELNRKRKELIRPIQNRLYEAIRAIATDEDYLIVFDVSENYGILYSNQKIDISDDVLNLLNEENNNN